MTNVIIRGGNRPTVTSAPTRPGDPPSHDERASRSRRCRHGFVAGLMIGAGTGLPLGAPFSTERMFEADQKVGVGLVNTRGRCWKADFDAGATKRNTRTLFKARTGG